MNFSCSQLKILDYLFNLIRERIKLLKVDQKLQLHTIITSFKLNPVKHINKLDLFRKFATYYVKFM